jgi:hypothetical protein
MGNRTSYEKLSLEDKVKVCVVYPCYLAINKTTHLVRCVCKKGKKTDNPDEMVVLLNYFYLPDKKIGFHFYKENNNYEEPFVLEHCLINMYNVTYRSLPNAKWIKPITKNLYDGIVERYNWQFDTDGKQKSNATSSVCPYKWLFKQKKELIRLYNEVTYQTYADVK